MLSCLAELGSTGAIAFCLKSAEIGVLGSEIHTLYFWDPKIKYSPVRHNTKNSNKALIKAFDPWMGFPPVLPHDCVETAAGFQSGVALQIHSRAAWHNMACFPITFMDAFSRHLRTPSLFGLLCRMGLGVTGGNPMGFDVGTPPGEPGSTLAGLDLVSHMYVTCMPCCPLCLLNHRNHLSTGWECTGWECTGWAGSSERVAVLHGTSTGQVELCFLHLPASSVSEVCSWVGIPLQQSEDDAAAPTELAAQPSSHS